MPTFRNIPFNSGDGLISYSQAEALLNALGNDKCSLYELIDVAHGDFGVDENGDPKKIHPDVEIKENDKEEDIEQKTVILNYYDKISEKLQELNAQENN